MLIYEYFSGTVFLKQIKQIKLIKKLKWLESQWHSQIRGIQSTGYVYQLSIPERARVKENGNLFRPFLTDQSTLVNSKGILDLDQTFVALWV